MLKNEKLAAVIILVLIIGALSGISCGRLKNIKASVSGTVYMDGRPVSGTVILTDQNEQVIAQERTNTNGHFRITDLQPGTYYIQYLNYQGVPWSTRQLVEVRLGRPEVVDLQLSAADRQMFNSN
jgi:hypothetical protein